MTRNRLTPPGYYVAPSVLLDGPCLHCGGERSEHIGPQQFCDRPPLELQRPALEGAA